MVDQVELIVGAAPLNLSPASAPFAPSFILFIGGELLLLFSIFQAFHIPKPFKISSLGKGAPARPCTYIIMEDGMAVDMGVGRAHRKAINARYEAMPMFRKLVYLLNCSWQYRRFVRERG